MSELIFQPVSEGSQIERTAKLAHRIWNEHFPPIIGQAQVNYMVEKFQSVTAITQQLQEGYTYFLLSCHQQDVGYLALRRDPDHRLFLSKLYIRADQRGQGFARQALVFVETQARDQSCTHVHLTCNKRNTSAIAAYEHLGFQHTAPVVMDIGAGFVMDDVTMEKRVHPSG